MGLDLGTLSAQVDIRTGDSEAKIRGIKDDLDSVGKSVDAASKKELSPKVDSGDIDKAGDAADDAGKKLDNVGKKKVKPKADAGEVDKAKTSANDLDTELDKVDKKNVRPDVDKQPIEDANEATKGLADSLGAVAAKGVKWAGMAAGAAAIGTIGTSIAKGFSRLDSIDQATAKLEALGNSGSDVQTIMDNALESVTGTAFGIGEAAGTAATMVASGIQPGQELQDVLIGVADSAAIGGSTMEEMGLIWGKAAAKGKVDGDIINQMLERQIPIYDILGEKMGETSENIADMVSDGKIDFQTFSEAMNDYMGGGAQRMGDTISGAMDNVGAALGRAGASFLEGGMAEAPDLLKQVTEQIDLVGEAVGPLGSELASRLAPAISDVVGHLGSGFVGGLNAAGDILSVVTPLVSGLSGALKAIPFPVVAGGLTALIAQHKGWTGHLNAGTGQVRDFAKNTVSSLGNVARTFGTAYTAGSSNLRGLSASYRSSADAAKQSSLTSKDAFTSIDFMGQSAARSFQASATSMGGAAKGLASGGLAVMQSGLRGAGRAANGLITALGGPWGLAIMAAGAALTQFAKKHQEAAAAELEHKSAQKELRGTLDETTGAITGQTEAMMLNRAEEQGWLQSATEIGLTHSDLTAAMMGSADAMERVDGAVRKSSASAVEGSKFWQQWGDRFEEFGVDAGTVAGNLEGSSEAGEAFADAMRSVNGELDFQDMNALKMDLNDLERNYDGAGEAAWAMRDGVVGAAQDLNELSVEDAKAKMEDLKAQVEDTTAVLKALGDVQFQIEDSKTISISTDDITDETMKLLEDTRVEVSEPFEGRVNLTFPDGAELMALLDELDIRLEDSGDGYINIDTSDVDAAIETLDLMGIKSVIEDGQLRIDTNADGVMDRLVELDLAVRDPKTGEVTINWLSILDADDRMDALQSNVDAGAFGEIEITDNTDDANARVDGTRGNVEAGAEGHAEISDNTDDVNARTEGMRGNVEAGANGHAETSDNTPTVNSNVNNMRSNVAAGADGEARMRDNAIETRNRIRLTLNGLTTYGTHYQNTVRSTEYVNTAGGNRSLPRSMQADGSVLDFYAEGGVRENHVAQIAPAGTWRVWAEPETGGEAYIPLAESKRTRSEQILNDVADRFGMALIDQDAIDFYADGGVSDRVRGDLQHAHGTPYVFGGWGPGGTDCSGAVSMGVNSALGLDPYDSRTATMTMGPWLENKGFMRGTGGPGDIRVAYLNGGPGGGHTAMQLPDGTYIESGGNTGGGLHIGGPAGPLEGRGFTDWYYLPMTSGDMPEFETGMGEEYFDAMGAESFDTGTRGGGGGGMSRRPASSYGAGGSGGGGPTTTINGGAGPMLRDGSFLEAAAAAYALHTGADMPDDVVSWGNVIGRGTTVTEDEPENLGVIVRQQQRELAKLERDYQGTIRDREQALADMDEMLSELEKGGVTRGSGDNEEFVPFTDEEIAERKRRILDQRDRIFDLEDSMEEYAEKHEELTGSQDKLREAIELNTRYQQSLPSGTGGGAGGGGVSAASATASGTSGNDVADAIISEGRRRGISDRGIEIALATALVESGLTVYANPAVPASMNMPHDAVGYDHDSVGVFQQRDNGAWGTLDQRMDPAKSAGLFYDKLDDADYNQGDPGAHAQRVQVSAFPERYGQRMAEAGELLEKYNQSGSKIITPMANGGILGSARSAQIRDSSAILWAEAGPEAYIPLSSDKRARSLDIWAETGKRLGVDVMSILNLIGSGLPGLMEGRLDFSTGGSTSLTALGLNSDAVSHRGAQAISNAVGAVFNGPVTVNDPREYLRGQLGSAEKMLGDAMRGFNL